MGSMSGNGELLFGIQIQQKIKEQINKKCISHFKPLNSTVCTVGL